MKRLLLHLVVILMALEGFNASGQRRHAVVADSVSGSPLVSASVFNKNGKLLGVSNKKGEVTCATAADYPLTIRYMGYFEKTILRPGQDSIFLEVNVADLPEFTVSGRQKKMLHILGYVREYSTLTSYSDTVTMFREKMVDFMLPDSGNSRYEGWTYPRVLNSRSYYHFTDAAGLDSVSDKCRHYFTWSDWIGMFPSVKIPPGVARLSVSSDTIRGKYSAAEIWQRNDDVVSVDVNVLADRTSRRWVPGISYYLDNDEVDFDLFRVRLIYGNVIGDVVTPLDLTGCSFMIESRGRAHGLFRFSRHDQPFFVSTYTELYILDKEFITVKEAKRWKNRKFNADETVILEPQDAPELQEATMALIERVNSINHDDVRLLQEVDGKLGVRNARKGNFNIGQRALTLLKQLSGITLYKSRKNFRKRWDEFKDDRLSRPVSTDPVPEDE